MTRIFLTHTPSSLEKYYGAEACEALSEIGDVSRNPTTEPLDASGLLEHAQGCEIIVSDRATPGRGEFFENAHELVAFLRCAVDIRNVDVGAASAAGILVTQATPGFAPAVAELAIGYMIDLSRGISGAAATYRQGMQPDARMGRQLHGSTVGIIGYGEIGGRLARLCLALGMNVIVSDPHKDVDMPSVKQLFLPEMLPKADFVVCLATALPETENLMNEAAFAAMQRHAVFINLSRGELVDEAALRAALDAGEIAGAAMDVGRAADQMPSPKLARHERVLATPHIGGLTPSAVQHQAFETVNQVRALLANRMPQNAVNPRAAHRLKWLGAVQEF